MELSFYRAGYLFGLLVKGKDQVWTLFLSDGNFQLRLLIADELVSELVGQFLTRYQVFIAQVLNNVAHCFELAVVACKRRLNALPERNFRRRHFATQRTQLPLYCRL